MLLAMKGYNNKYARLTLTEIIFTGRLTDISLSTLIEDLLIDGNDINFISPEVQISNTKNEIINVLETFDYIDLTIAYNYFNGLGINIPRLFCNMGIENGKLEILLFFDLKDLEGTTYKTIIDKLRDWCIKFKEHYNFSYMRCQLDNGDKEEFYFDCNGLGPEYNKIR